MINEDMLKGITDEIRKDYNSPARIAKQPNISFNEFFKQEVTERLSFSQKKFEEVTAYNKSNPNKMIFYAEDLNQSIQAYRFLKNQPS
ncbi:hypothetical protein L3V86_00100 [Thiotrichales bacterium 19S11-10]|nr:hypothetical protein [Thiotrichales bacterium 19S11-10]